MTNPQQPSRTLHVVLWVAQILLSALFLMGSYLKWLIPLDQLSAMMPWTGQVSPAFVRLTGVFDALAGVGLILPALLRIKSVLTAWAAVGGAAILISATIFHLSRGEFSSIGMNIVFAGVAIFVAWGRFGKGAVWAR